MYSVFLTILSAGRRPTIIIMIDVIHVPMSPSSFLPPPLQTLPRSQLLVSLLIVMAVETAAMAQTPFHRRLPTTLKPVPSSMLLQPRKDPRGSLRRGPRRLAGFSARPHQSRMRLLGVMGTGMFAMVLLKSQWSFGLLESLVVYWLLSMSWRIQTMFRSQTGYQSN